MAWLKSQVKRLLGKVVHRSRFNDSMLYGWYLRVVYPEDAKRRTVEQQFYQQALGARTSKLVFDVGANGGGKAAIFLTFAKRVICVEPDPTAIKVLKDRFLHRPSVVIVEKGVDAAEGVSEFHLFDGADAYNTFSTKWASTLATVTDSGRSTRTAKDHIEIPVTTLDRLIEEFGVPDYLKIDVEGYELPAIRGLTQSVPLLSFECNLPEFTAETLECLSLLAQRSQAAKFNYCVTEPPARFESEQWISHDQMAAIVESGDQRFMEIYCRS